MDSDPTVERWQDSGCPTQESKINTSQNGRYDAMPDAGLQAKYVHTNIVARDWRSLARFYEVAFGCTPMPPERDYHGDWVTDLTCIPDATIEGMHLQLPGYESGGPTLEIFQYNRQPDRPPVALNQPGFAHIAFHVDDVPRARQAVLDAGGKDLGKLHSMLVPGAGHITLIYMTDPEGNIVELQTWSHEARASES